MPEEPPSAKPYPWKCGRCRERTVSPALIDYLVNIEHDGLAYDVRVPRLPVARCQTCGEVVLDDAANERISVVFMRAIVSSFAVDAGTCKTSSAGQQGRQIVGYPLA